MSAAFHCVFLAILFPYVFTILAKAGKGFDNRRPREILEKRQGWRKRAHWVQLNSFEILPAFAAAVIIATLSTGAQQMIDNLAIGFLVSRVAYAVCYISDQALLRSLSWGIGFGCIVGLFFV